MKTVTGALELVLEPFMQLCTAKPIFVIYHTMLTERILDNTLFYIFYFFTLKFTVHVPDILDRAERVALFLQELVL